MDSFRQSKARQTTTVWIAARGRTPFASWNTRSMRSPRTGTAAGRGGSRVHLVDDEDAGPPGRAGSLREHQNRRLFEIEAASEVRGGG